MREEENKTSSRKKSTGRKVIQLFPKRKAAVIYLASGAFILTGAMIYQLATKDPSPLSVGGEPFEEGMANNSEESKAVSGWVEEIQIPALNVGEVTVVKHFYDDNLSAEEQQEALIFYDNQYTKNTGTDFAEKDNQAFEVAAALSGTVASVEEDSLLGKVVELEHANGLTTVYQSLDNVQVETGDTVAQGEVIANAGQSVIGKDLGRHLHFEIRKDEVAVNPETSFEKTPSTLLAELNKEPSENGKK